MRKVLTVFTFIALIVLLGTSSEVAAQAPNTIIYQGRLTDAAGDAITVNTSVAFSIYTVPTEGSYIYTETETVSPDENGVFTVELGPVTTSHFDGTPRYLGIKVGTDDEMIPRQLLTSAPYAFAAANFPNTITANKTFTGNVYFGDSTMRVNNNGIRIGDPSAPSSTYLAYLERNLNTTSSRYALYSYLANVGTGSLYGLYSYVYHSTQGSGGETRAVYGTATSDGSNRYGVRGYAQANNIAITTGSSYGVYGSAADGANAYGVYGYAFSATNNYAGYFSGNARVTGTLSKGGGSFMIDHPLDPENKYLFHSFVESPDMMNVYNGNVATDAMGKAVVELPDYFEALNKDFRYQLTVIGDFAQAAIAEEVSNNQFVIRTDKPNVKVSWQVTGIRKDAFAEANRIQVEVEKPAAEKGLYLHPEALGYSPKKFIHYEQNKQAEREMQKGKENDEQD